jgi:hypothetical protein
LSELTAGDQAISRSSISYPEFTRELGLAALPTNGILWFSWFWLLQLDSKKSESSAWRSACISLQFPFQEDFRGKDWKAWQCRDSQKPSCLREKTGAYGMGNEEFMIDVAAGLSVSICCLSLVPFSFGSSLTMSEVADHWCI